MKRDKYEIDVTIVVRHGNGSFPETVAKSESKTITYGEADTDTALDTMAEGCREVVGIQLSQYRDSLVVND